MARQTIGPEIERLIQLLARLPGLGPRSARRAALHLIKKKDQLLGPLAQAMGEAHERVRICSTCGQTGPLEIHDRRIKRWRHLDLGASRCGIECELRLLRCRDCGVRLEAVPWARPGAHHSRDFEDTVAWLAQQMAFCLREVGAIEPVGKVGNAVVYCRPG